MKLFKYEGFNIEIAPQALRLKAFRDLYERDTSKDKSRAIDELTFVYFFTDPRSDYMITSDEDSRINAIKADMGLPSNWTPDDKVMKAVELYKSFRPVSAMLLDDAYYMINKLRERMRNVDYDERDEKGRPLYTFESVTKTVMKIPELVDVLGKAVDRVNKDILEQEKASGTTIEQTILDKSLDIYVEK